jgi:hypothetical protein
MNRFQLWWLHFRLCFFGDKTYEKHGGGIIPCKKCGRLFQSWEHFDYYDALCEWCEFATKDPKTSKREIENILSEYNRGIRDWGDTIAYLRSIGIKVRREQI